jgi:hypothetical protein
MSDSDDNLRLEIGHVLFIDIVGYSKLLIEEQKERLNQLPGRPALHRLRAKDRRDAESRRQAVMTIGWFAPIRDLFSSKKMRSGSPRLGRLSSSISHAKHRPVQSA